MSKLKDDELYDELYDELNDDNEFVPDTNDKKWQKEGNYSIYRSEKKIQYKIDDQLIDEMKDFNKRYNKLKNKSNALYENEDVEVKRIYIIYTKDFEKFRTGHTSGSVYKMIKTHIHKYLLGQDNNFTKMYVNPLDTQVLLLEYVKNVTRKDLVNIKKYYEDYYLQNANKGPNVKYKCHEFIFSVMTKVISYSIPNNMEKTKYYIYELVNKIDNKKFVGITSQQITSRSKKKLLTQAKKFSQDMEDIEQSDIILNVIEIMNCYLLLECWLKADLYILMNDSVKNGYNNEFYFYQTEYFDNNCTVGKKAENLQKNIFLNIQKEILLVMFKDKSKDYYKDIEGFIYEVKYKEKKNVKRYISLMRGRTFKFAILHLYNLAIRGITKIKNKSKISKLLESVPYIDLDISILKEKTKDSDMDLDLELDKLRKKYDTIENGYNVNEYNIKKINAVRRMTVKGKIKQ